jgi:succinate-acetate transporter protein
MLRVGLNTLLTIVFAVLSIGAFMDGRWQALPVAIIFAAFAIYSAVKAVVAFRKPNGHS